MVILRSLSRRFFSHSAFTDNESILLRLSPAKKQQYKRHDKPTFGNQIKTMATTMEHTTKLLSQKEAIELDQELFSEYGFSVDQLMELAGYSVACAINNTYRDIRYTKPIICCGPGNNGGDGLVCARHLKIFGYQPVIINPKPTFNNLLKQCQKFNIPILHEIPNDVANGSKGDSRYNLIIDAVFGFSYKPPSRNKDLAKLLNQMHHMSKTNDVPIVSIDIPSGWSVETGPIEIDKHQESVEQELRLPKLEPDCLISLTAPKLCSAHFKGRFHYLGGRFCPPSIQEKYKLNLPTFKGTEQTVLLTSTVDFKHYW